MIHPSAIVDPKAEIGADVSIGPYCIVEGGVQIGSGSKLQAHVIVRKGTSLANQVQVDSFSVLGGDPQDVSFNLNTPTYVKVGAHTIIREGVTISRATQAETATIVGEHCLLMGHSHVAHDCKIGNYVRLTNQALLGGFVVIDDYANIGGGAAIHQNVHVGEYVIIGGRSGATKEVPPYLMIVDRNRVVGLNVVGLKRSGITADNLRELKFCYQFIYLEGPGGLRDKAKQLLSKGLKSAQAKRFVRFFLEGSSRGFVRPSAS